MPSQAHCPRWSNRRKSGQSGSSSRMDAGHEGFGCERAVRYKGPTPNEYRNAFINDYIKTLDESLHPLSAYAQAVKAANEAV